MIRRWNVVAAVLMMAARALCAGSEPVHYLGTIDTDLDVAVAIDAGDKGKVTGTYLYARYGKVLFLQGKQTGATLALKESTNFEDNTGAFALTEGKDGGLKGTWKSPDGKRTWPVELLPVARTVTLKEEKSGVYTVTTGYLKFTGNTAFHVELNAELEKEATAAHGAKVKEMTEMTTGEGAAGNHAAPYTATEDPMVLFADKTRVSIRTILGEYTGGAHNNYAYAVANYAWREGKLVKLTTADFLAITPANLQALREICVKDLTAQKASWPGDLKFDVKEPPEINVTNYGILLTFPPYEVGSFAEGTYVVSLANEKIDKLRAEKNIWGK